MQMENSDNADKAFLLNANTMMTQVNIPSQERTMSSGPYVWLSFFISLLISSTAFAGPVVQTIKGTVIDQQSKSPIPGVSVVLLTVEPLKGATTDVNGNFRIENVPIGKHSLKASFIGYAPVVIPNIQLTSGKEFQVSIALLEDVQKLSDIVVEADAIKDGPINEIATVSARSFSLDEATRFAGSFADPSRMALNYAGVASSGDIRNDIVVRGNSPSGVQYRIDGISVPNPNHFGTFGTSGGAISMISQNVLSTSDFLSGAFPAEYGDVLSAVFDINFRKGNPDKAEKALQVGFRGLEAAMEGPISKGSNASYLVNYRYSTLQLMDAMGFEFAQGVNSVPNYQDLAFKLHFPLKGGNSISVVGLGGYAEIFLKDSEQEDPEDFFSIDRPNDVYSSSRNAFTSVSYNHFYNKNTYGKLILSLSSQFTDYFADSLFAPSFKEGVRANQGDFTENRARLFYLFNKKLNARNTFSGGFQTDIIAGISQESRLIQDEMETITDYDGTTQLMRVFGNWQFRLNNQLTLNTGVNIQHLRLSESTSVEPRVGMKWAFQEGKSVSLAYGLHSQSIPIYAYFIQGQDIDGNTVFKNRELELMKNRHFILSYDQLLSRNLRLKVETYYQRLFDIPVERIASSYSVLNEGADFNGYPPDRDILVNNGTGRNFGIELTLERFFNDDYYFLLTTSLYDSRFKGSDGVLRNTAFNGNYVANLLLGKEFTLSDSKTLTINFKSTLAGGRRYTDADQEASSRLLQTVLKEDEAFELQFRPYMRQDFKIMYAINKKKSTHQLSLDIQNLLNRQNEFEKLYSVKEGRMRTAYQQSFLPEIQYRVLF